MTSEKPNESSGKKELPPADIVSPSGPVDAPKEPDTDEEPIDISTADDVDIDEDNDVDDTGTTPDE